MASIAETVEKAFKIKQQIDGLLADLAGVKAELVEFAKNERGKENTVRLDGVTDIQAVIRFTQSISFDSKALFAALEILKARKFDKLFSTVTSYRARPALEKFLHAKGNLAARRAIAAATTVTDNSPKLTFEEDKEGE